MGLNSKNTLEASLYIHTFVLKPEGQAVVCKTKSFYRSVQKTRAAIISQKIPKGSLVYMGLPPHLHWVCEILTLSTSCRLKASARLPFQSSRNGRGRGRSSAFKLKGLNLSFSWHSWYTILTCIWNDTFWHGFDVVLTRFDTVLTRLIGFSRLLCHEPKNHQKIWKTEIACQSVSLRVNALIDPQ